MRIAVLISGSGSNLQAIIDAVAAKDLKHVEIVAVIADRNCYGLERALDAELPTWFVERSETLSSEIDEICENEKVDLIVLAGFLSILNEEFCTKWDKKIINLHPSLLPKYGGMGMYGAKVHKAVLANNEKESGATVHYVSSGVDEGEIILQESFEIPAEADLDWLQQKISEVEKPLLLKAIQKLADNSI
ncbi:phosphoribosylglycinamide formyltransferase [Weeksellaceae bacterium KMM 9724]|uniref:phosphoribosylglycinamide formyltransferase n=1 Tax=Profundicola chukchiensis TaxID=2961959 RepID=UPI00243AACD3|nr:phosphoribosylglycinamide formyltransferase [Profundicola chukchiensis]MDG4950356.1 phosphoribosylglycinamide formyltransferase [Profundicola chukchiensis]